MILSPKHLPRLISTIRLFTNYGLRDFANRQGLLNLEGAALDEEPGVEGDAKVKAKAFKERLVELGPAYIKLGQILSTRPDLLPRPYIEELPPLQDDVPPMPYEDVEHTVEQELQERISKLFASFDVEQLGSASLGEVHAAVGVNGPVRWALSGYGPRSGGAAPGQIGEPGGAGRGAAPMQQRQYRITA